VVLTTNPHVAEVKERIKLNLYSPRGIFMACSRVSFTFTYYFIEKNLSVKP
jgi:hypothetical protein